MATVTLTLANICAGGEHVRISCSLNGNNIGEYGFGLEELRVPISVEDREATVKTLIKLHAIGKTRAQLRTSLGAGVEVAL